MPLFFGHPLLSLPVCVVYHHSTLFPLAPDYPHPSACAERQPLHTPKKHTRHSLLSWDSPQFDSTAAASSSFLCFLPPCARGDVSSAAAAWKAGSDACCLQRYAHIDRTDSHTRNQKQRSCCTLYKHTAAAVVACGGRWCRRAVLPDAARRPCLALNSH